MTALEYKAETEEDINDLTDCALSIRALARLGKKIQENDKNNEFHYEKIRTFELIETLLEPVLTVLCRDAVDVYGGRKKINVISKKITVTR
jgi:hypothetical protein